MENISQNMSTELEPPYEGFAEPTRYLPEREMREAIFGGDIDTGAAGLVSFLQSFASVGQSDGSKKRVKKEAAPVEDKGFVAVAIGGEWTLQPSAAVGAHTRPFSPKMRPHSPGGISKQPSFSFSSPVQPSPHPLTQSPQSFVIEGTAVSPSHKAKGDDFLKLKVPALSPNDHRRLALKLGLDVEQQQALESAAAAGVPANAEGVEVSEDLLGLVREFYLEKQAEEERIERLKRRATTTYFPANFRQNQNITQEMAPGGKGEYHHLSQLVYDDHSDMSDAEGLGEDHAPRAGHNLDTPPVTNMRHFPSARSPSMQLSSSEVSPDQSNKYTRRASSMRGSGESGAGGHVPHAAVPYSSNAILAAVASVANAAGAAHAVPAVAGVAAGTTTAPSQRKMSLRMERMLSRRSSYNPTEVRLELLQSIHSPVGTMKTAT
jgi:hypothetical protein